VSAVERHQRIVEQAVYTPVRQGDIVAETVARLGQAIGMGLLRPGDRLPPEARLAADLGISPVSLRSALNMLRGAGVLETSRGRGGGTVVTADASALPLASDRAMPSEAELSDLADLRCVVEGGAAAFAAERATAEQLEHLADLAAEMESESQFGAWSERDTLLHLVIADASGSERVVAQIGRLREEVYQLGQRIPTPHAAVELANREHRDLIAAIAARDPERARQAMVHHVQSTRALWLGLGRVPS
jgi:GntR family transcriptional regulator, transcriptional repressor for pyruvate dehydrogenase complex